MFPKKKKKNVYSKVAPMIIPILIERVEVNNFFHQKLQIIFIDIHGFRVDSHTFSKLDNHMCMLSKC